MRWIWEVVLGFHWHDWKWGEQFKYKNCYAQRARCQTCGKEKEITIAWIGE